MDSGYWPLYRWDPRKGKLQLDAPPLAKAKVALSEFMDHENRFLRLKREHPEAAASLVPQPSRSSRRG